MRILWFACGGSLQRQDSIPPQCDLSFFCTIGNFVSCYTKKTRLLRFRKKTGNIPVVPLLFIYPSQDIPLQVLLRIPFPIPCRCNRRNLSQSCRQSCGISPGLSGSVRRSGAMFDPFPFDSSQPDARIILRIHRNLLCKTSADLLSPSSLFL